MKKIFILVTFLIITFLVAKDNYSEMSNEELIAIIGYVSTENKKEFYKELNSRLSTMTSKEKRAFSKAIKEKKKDEN